ncbi:MAG: UPF0262 family protein [Hyphomicrobiaceae bacterium]|nr:UPF0262 family protein [Hyphomicrobiaceae bacterium]MCC0006746.1 UPF0262 family protein [Hyphomicrobiaceae bacterium]
MHDEGTAEQPSRMRLYAIDIDEKSIARNNSNIEHEREVAIFDLLDGNSFAVTGREDGPYRLRLSIVDQKLAFAVGTESEEVVVTHFLSLTPFKRIIKDYFMVCDSYYEAIRTAPPSKIQAIDMGRRGLHDEGSRTLQERLQGKIDVDFDTARRLFTLICALHWKG